MSKKKEKKLEHIQVKDNGIKLSQKIGDKLNDVSQELEATIEASLIKDTEDLRRWQIKKNNEIRNFKKQSKELIQKAAKEIKKDLKNDASVNLKPHQAVAISSQINKGLLFLQDDATRTFQKIVQQTMQTLRVNKTLELQQALSKHMDAGLDIGVVYKDGKHYEFDTYFEMKARTDIQQDIGSNMISTGQESGVVFYISAYFGDCAKDHVDLNGKIFCDEKWESLAPKDRVDEIRDYIEANKIMTVQEAMGEPYYYTTRPNCRHYFQYIDIDSVIGAKTQKEVSNLRDDRDLNFNGKYKPEKYKALQQQRANERQIRAEKKEIEHNEKMLALDPNNDKIKSSILRGEARVRDIQAKQRELINNNSNLVRQYDREQVGNRITLNVDK